VSCDMLCCRIFCRVIDVSHPANICRGALEAYMMRSQFY